MPTLAQAISDLTTLAILVPPLPSPPTFQSKLTPQQPIDTALHLLRPHASPTTEQLLDGSEKQHQTPEYARAVEFLKLKREEGKVDQEWEELKAAVEGVVREREREGVGRR